MCCCNVRILRCQCRVLVEFFKVTYSKAITTLGYGMYMTNEEGDQCTPTNMYFLDFEGAFYNTPTSLLIEMSLDVLGHPAQVQDKTFNSFF